MPIYEYECTNCGQIEEVIQKFSDRQLKKCPHCSGKLSRLISQSSFHLKGTGWYVTDYASGKKSSSASGNKPHTSSSPKAEKGSTSKKDKTTAT